MKREGELYGLLAEFKNVEDLTSAAGRVHKAGYKNIDAYAPFPSEELTEAMGVHWSPVPLIILCAGIMGGLLGLTMQYYSTVHHYPLNIGGRPMASWIAYIPITFECTVLCASYIGAISMLAVNGLPMPHHPLFNEKKFEGVSRDKFFLCIEARDKKFNVDQTRAFLESLHPVEVIHVTY